MLIAHEGMTPRRPLALAREEPEAVPERRIRGQLPDAHLHHGEWAGRIARCHERVTAREKAAFRRLCGGVRREEQ